MEQEPEVNPFIDLVKEFEKSVKSFVGIYNVEMVENKTNYEYGKKTSASQIEQNKKNIDQATEEMYERARNLETTFLRYRLEILKNAPEQLILEEVNCMRAELKRKDDLLNDAKKKIMVCEQNLKTLGLALDQQMNYNPIMNENPPAPPQYATNQMSYQ